LPRNWDYNWHHIAGVYDGEDMAIFIDGEKVKSKPAHGAIRRSRHPVNIGRNHQRHHEQWPGFLSNAIVDDIRIWNDALSEKEIESVNQQSADRNPQSVKNDSQTADSGLRTAERGKPHAERHLLLSLNFDTTTTSGTFFSYGATPQGSGTMDGIINEDRSLQPEAWQVKKSHEPVKCYPINLRRKDKKVIVENRFHFTDLSELETRWALYEDFVKVQGDTITCEVPAMSSDTLTIPIRGIDLIPGAVYRLVLSFKTKGPSWWAEKGYEVAFSEMEFYHVPPRQLDRDRCAPLSFRNDPESITIAGYKFEYLFDKTTGGFSTLIKDGNRLENIAPSFNVWRTPIMNEWSEWGVKEVEAWYKLGLDSLVHRVTSVDVFENFSNEVKIIAVAESKSARNPETSFLHTYTYRIIGCGDIILDHEVTCRAQLPGYPDRDIPWLPKIGLQFKLPRDLQKITWYGRGPWETYPDRKSGAKMGLYTENLDEINMPYIIPQDFGNHADVKWTFLSREDRSGLLIVADESMNVSVDPYENLDQAWYPFDLKRAEQAMLNIDFKVTGVGGTPIQVQAPYRTYPNQYFYSLRIRPVTRIDNVAEIGREDF
jgi:beta-galactosidase